MLESDEQKVSFMTSLGDQQNAVTTIGDQQNAVTTVGDSQNSTDEKKTSISEDDLKVSILNKLFHKHVSLKDDQLSQIFGYPEEKIGEIRKRAYRSDSMEKSNETLSYDYCLCFNAGDEKLFRKPNSREVKKRSKDDNLYNDEWENGMKQTKYFSQIFLDIWKRLEQAKLSVVAYRSPDSGKMFLIVGITEENLRYWADERDTDLEINAVEAVKDGRRRGFALAERTVIENEEPNENRSLEIDLWEHLFVQYNPRANSKIYRHYPRVRDNQNLTTIFDEKTRLRIIYETMIADGKEGGAEITIKEYLMNDHHPLKAVFPFHHQGTLDEFDRTWIQNWKCSYLMWCPLGDVRSYFGEPVAFYFGFLMFYLRWLIAPAIIGLIFFIEQLGLDKLDVPAIQIMSFFIIIWAVAFVDYWKRQEATYRLEWGMTKFEQKAVSRPEFHGSWKYDAVTGLLTEQFSFFERAVRVSSTLFIIMIFLTGCIAAVVTILLIRDRDPNNTALKVGLGVANGVLIFIFDVIYSKISYFGNDFENHRTEEDYLNALITKSFIFRFFNSFASLFYLAFVRPAVDGRLFYLRYYTSVCSSCDDHVISYINKTLGPFHTINLDNKSYPNKYWQYCYESYNFINSTDGVTSVPPPCTTLQVREDMNNAILSDVRIQLVTLFLTAIFIQNFLEVFVPYMLQKVNDYQRKRAQALLPEPPSSKRSEPEEQWSLEPYANTLEDVSELIVQFGYVSLFIISLPITPLLAFINNIFEMKVDAINLVRQSQRPNPSGSSGLGAWNSILEFFSVICVGTNVAMMTFSTQIVENLTKHETNEWKWIFFTFVAIAMTLIISFEKYIIPDVPEEVEQAIERQRLIENVLVLGANTDSDANKPGDDDDETFTFNPALEGVPVSDLDKIPASDVSKAQITKKK